MSDQNYLSNFKENQKNNSLEFNKSLKFDKKLSKVSTKGVNNTNNFDKYIKNLNSKSLKGDISGELNPDSFREIKYDTVKVSKPNSMKSQIINVDEDENNLSNNYELIENNIGQNNNHDRVNNDFILESYSNEENIQNIESETKFEKNNNKEKDEYAMTNNFEKKESAFMKSKKSIEFIY
jgi:hypothetical protein